MVTTSQSASLDSGDFNNDGPLSGSFHGSTTATHFSPQNSMQTSADFAVLQQKSGSPNDHRDHINDRLMQPKELTKTLSLDRTNDHVYSSTTNVVKAIMVLTQGVQTAIANEYLDLVRNVGIELRTLLSSVDSLASIFPPQALK